MLVYNLKQRKTNTFLSASFLVFFVGVVVVGVIHVENDKSFFSSTGTKYEPIQGSFLKNLPDHFIVHKVENYAGLN